MKRKANKTTSFSTKDPAILGVAWYQSEQWPRLREVASDSENLEQNYPDWEANANEAIRNLRRAGARVERVVIDIEELVEWCGHKGRAVDSSARAEFTSEKLREKHTGKK